MLPIDDTVKGFIEEVKGYIDPITEGIQAYYENPEQREALEEAHRYVHTIKGASSLLDFIGLSHVAEEMEKALNDVFSGTMDITEPVLKAMLHTVDQIKTYCDEMAHGEVDEKAMAREAVVIYRRLYNLPEDEDEEAFNTIWESGLGTQMEPPSEMEVGLEEDESFFKDLIESFYVEAEEHMENTARFLNVIDSQVQGATEITDDLKDAIKEVRRSVHTVKGAAGMVKLTEIQQWAHEIEDVLDWFYEEADKIDRPFVELLYEATDLLQLFLSNPLQVDNERLNTIQKRLKEIITGDSSEHAAIADDQSFDEVSEVVEEKDTVEIFQQEPGAAVIEEAAQIVPDASFGKTLRVQMEKVDNLVNLGGELSIALSGCEQKMEMFTNSLRELELSRDRLRTIARDLETDYEVKAIQGLGTTLSSVVAGGASVLQAGVFDEFDSLELDRYSEFNLLIRSLAEAVVDMGAINTQMLSIYSELDGFLNRQRVLLSELQNNMMLIRMTPMSSISNRIRQTVREVSRDLDKPVKLIIEGEEIELDRQIWDRMMDPIMHILRNAIDHGIESQSQRKELGKPVTGTIKVWAAREGNQVVIRIADDGAGIDYERIRDKIRTFGMNDNVDQMSDEELALMIFQPGFTTSDDVTQLSGRGVGLDVVKNNIENLKGSVSVSSVKHHGIQFTIRIPLTLAVAESLLFALDKQQYAIPLSDVSEVFRTGADRIPDDHEGELEIDGEALPLFNLRKLLKKNISNEKPASLSGDQIVLVLDIGGRRMAMTIENMIGKKEIVIKSMGEHLKHVKGISGATILGDGRVVPILNIEELVGGGPIITEGSEDAFQQITGKQLEILVVDDSVSVRQVVARLLESQGWKSKTAKDGIEALERIRESIPDLIVLDIEMPRMNGYEFLNAMYAQSRYKNVPVVMLTSRATSKHREKAMSLGAKGFVVKPYKDEEFVEIVMKLTAEGS